MRWDIFISHAHEDKAEVARPLAHLLRQFGHRVWIDEAELSLGDSLREKIDQGLAQSRFGLVILSESFFSKRWPQIEFNALWAREDDGQKVVLPVWHKISRERIGTVAPLLADKLAVSTANGLEEVARAVHDVVGGSQEVAGQRLQERYASAFSFPDDLIGDARSAIGRLADPHTWPQLEPEVDMSRSGVWIGSDSPVLVESIYSLYAPIALFRSLRYSLKRSISTFSSESRLRYALLESAFFGLTNEELLASSGERIDYSPRSPGWRRQRDREPTKFWWQGLSEERFDRALPYLLGSPTPEESASLLGNTRFETSFSAAFRTCGRQQQDIGLLGNPLYGFRPSTRPVYWRLLTFWDRLYRLYEHLESNDEVVWADVEEAYRCQKIALGRDLDRSELFESIQSSWAATGHFWERFICPRAESVLDA